MASLDFYALKEDIRKLMHFLFEETDVRVSESYSEFDAELREFRSFQELSDAFDLGTDEHGTGCRFPLQLWSPRVTEDESSRAGQCA